ncbi:hypothetical protein ACFX10_022634 [Malus domestica]
MYEPDKEKITFVIEQGTYCYKVMPFGLKNTKATYQRLVNMMFKKQIGVTMEVYVDDIMVKGKQRSAHIDNLVKTFSILIKYKMKLNPIKCIFGVSSGRFLGYQTLELGQYGLVFLPHTTIKAQALVDFISKFTHSLGDATKRPNNTPETAEHTLVVPVSPNEDFLHLHVDGMSNYKGSGAGVVLVIPDGSMLEQAITLGFKAFNNEAEYEALLAGLQMAKDLRVKKLAIHFDS